MFLILARKRHWGAAAFLVVKFVRDEVPQPHLRGIVVSLAVPDHPQDKGRKAKGLWAGNQTETPSEGIHN